MVLDILKSAQQIKQNYLLEIGFNVTYVILLVVHVIVEQLSVLPVHRQVLKILLKHICGKKLANAILLMKSQMAFVILMKMEDYLIFSFHQAKEDAKIN